PLLVAGDRLYAQAGVKRNRLRVLAFDLTRSGECVLESDPVVLPAWVVTGDCAAHSFTARWRLENGELVLSWQARGSHPQAPAAPPAGAGGPPGGGRGRPGRAGPGGGRGAPPPRSPRRIRRPGCRASWRSYRCAGTRCWAATSWPSSSRRSCPPRAPRPAP